MLSETTKIDTSYDGFFSNDLNLPWLPWVGVNFTNSTTKTIILGESTYNWDPDNLDVKKRIANNNHLRVLHQNHALDTERPSKYVRNIEKAIFQQKHPSRENKLKLWNSVVYHNLVLRMMQTRKDRPTFDDYKEGWEVYLELMAKLDIDECLVYGLEAKKYKALIEVLENKNIDYIYIKLDTKVGRSFPRIIKIKDSSHSILFMQHPSAYFSWKKWSKILEDHLTLSKVEITNRQLTSTN